ncbi:hypothetical protein K438DRAFT_1758069 [Mycena galopus ATCC 62051]|nr:hypothetical protein K438DRAFT_1758069 [Mycena galopus ATCC 62051]
MRLDEHRSKQGCRRRRRSSAPHTCLRCAPPSSSLSPSPSSSFTSPSASPYRTKPKTAVPLSVSTGTSTPLMRVLHAILRPDLAFLSWDTMGPLYAPAPRCSTSSSMPRSSRNSSTTHPQSSCAPRAQRGLGSKSKFNPKPEPRGAGRGDQRTGTGAVPLGRVARKTSGGDGGAGVCAGSARRTRKGAHCAPPHASPRGSLAPRDEPYASSTKRGLSPHPLLHPEAAA